MRLLPVFLKMRRRLCLVVGAGKAAEEKIRGLLAAQARVRVVAPRARHTVRRWAESGRVEWQQRRFECADLQGVRLVIAATASRNVNREVFREAKRLGILCNVVDVPELCDFYSPAVVRRGDLQIAISTGGASPALAKRLRRELEQQFGPAWAGWIKRLGEKRRRLLARNMRRATRRRMLLRMALAGPPQGRTR